MSNPFTFETATKDQAKARVALAGPAGSGKTWTALVLAGRFAHPGERIAVVDTERGSASKYAGEFAFDRLNLTRYDPHDVPGIFAAAAAAGYAVVIIDSLSKFWSGAGGMLEQVDNSAKRSYGNNQFGGWKEARPVEAAMIEAMLGYPGHVIVTMRTKTAYEVTTDDRGKKVPVKIGLKPEQREGIEYEFDVVGDMDVENTLTVSKSRCSALSGAVIRRPGPDVAETILAWLSDGVPVLDANAYRDLTLAETDPGELRELYRQVKDRGLYHAAVIGGTGETTTLGELIVQRGKDVAPVRAADQLPRNSQGAIARSQATDAELDNAGLMTTEQQKEHTALGGGHPGEHKTAKPDRAKVSRERPTSPAVTAETASTPDPGPSAAAPPDDPWAGEPPEETEDKPGSIDPPNLSGVQALFARWFTPAEREQRIAAAEQVIHRELTGPKKGRTFSNLSLAEARKLLDTLMGIETRDDLIAELAAGADAQIEAPA